MKGTPSEPQHALKLVWAGTKIKALNVLEDVELRNGIKEYSNWPTIPQVYVKAEFVGDCDIVLNMHQSEIWDVDKRLHGNLFKIKIDSIIVKIRSLPYSSGFLLLSF
ncbi:3933_t:CDS:2 [Entrophospora sp. SA101]|nr:3933_t:CDS:2 [Entrophospora sp. SA101]